MQKPVSLLPVCRKFFEKLIFKEMFDFFYWERGNVIKAICLELGDSCMNQIVSLVHEIHKSLHNVIKVRSVFLDISKAFDEVWNEGILFRLKQNSISGELLNVLPDFSKDRKQTMLKILEGLIFSLLLFLIYINDQPEGLFWDVKLLTLDTSLFCCCWWTKICRWCE